MNSDRLFEMVETISKVSDKKSKHFYMVPELEKVLWYAYNPDITYGLRRIYTSGVGHGQFNDLTWRLLDTLWTRKMTGNTAFEITAKYVRSLTPDSAELFKRIIRRDLRCGIGASLINEKFPKLIPVHSVMLAQNVDWGRIVYPVFTGFKLDGIRARYTGKRFVTRRGKEIKGVDHIIKVMYNNAIRAEIDGELMIPGVDFNTGSGMIRSHNECPTAVFHAFDTPTIKEPFRSRMFILEGMLSHLAPHIQTIQNFQVSNIDQLMWSYNRARLLGHEGIMIKTPQHMYTPKRSWDWMKVKAVESVDGKIIGIYNGTGKNKNRLGGFIVDVDGTDCRVGSGFSDQQRINYYERGNEVLGRTCEFLRTEKFASGNARHSRFVRLRDDK